jgi:hypothetical protein
MSILNDVDRDFSAVYDNRIAYPGYAKTLRYTDKRLKKFIISQELLGIDRSEAWSLNASLAAFLVPRLEMLAVNTKSTPPGLSMSKWRRIIKQMAKGFRFYTEGWPEFDEFSKKDFNRLKQSVRLLFIWFHHLWS